MYFVDTHTHLFLEEFDQDRDEVIDAAIKNKVEKMFLPDIDQSTSDKVIALTKKYPNICYPMIGLHPTSVKQDFKDQLQLIEKKITKEKYFGIGETGVDLYWDKTHLKEQQEAFIFQINLAKKYHLPIIIHSRESFNEIFEILDKHNDDRLRGIFHSFTGTPEMAEKIKSYGGFKIGIGGIVTFKNSGLAEVVGQIGIEHLVLETDAPYLAPHPKRGKRNQSAYIPYIAQKIADIYQISLQQVAEITSQNAVEIFNLD